MNLAIRPLAPDLWPGDLLDLFGENGAVGGCWCMWIGRAMRRNPREKNKAAFREVVERGPPPGLPAIGACG